MRNKLKSILFAVIISIATIMGCFTFNFSSQKSSSAVENTDLTSTDLQNDVSIFIRKPTYSVFYNNKLYFIDEADGLFKVYNITSKLFESKYINLAEYEIIDTSFSDKNLFLLVKKENINSVIKINLDTFEIDDNFTVNTTMLYETFYTSQATFDSKSYTVLTFSSRGFNPTITLVDNETNQVYTSIEIQFNNVELQNTIKTNLKKTISYQKTTNNLYIIFIYNYSLAYCTISGLDGLELLKNNVVSNIGHTDIQNEDSSVSFNDALISEVGFAKINNVDYLSIAYNLPYQKNDNELIKLYSLNLENPTATVNYIAQFSCLNSKYTSINGDYCSYVDDINQKLFYLKINENYSINLTEINNPIYNINYYSDEEFVYKQTIEDAELFDNPWGANPSTEIPEGIDVIKIGSAYINNQNEIKDYDYCLFTSSDKNFCGFIKSSHLQNKTVISVAEAGYKKRVCVWPNSTLYSLPTTVVKGQIIGSLTSQKIIEKIQDNSELEVLDILCGYSANNSKMVKVRVNGNQVGYIEAKCIHSPAEIVEFVITNATIKKDNTTVYLSPSGDATTLTFKLDAGKNVRINGKRDTKTGWTSITFNDEYGNEFSGYIDTDYIKADSWSTLQIIGCVLIAINIGLLILILVYKKEHLGGRGQKIEEKTEIVK